MKELKMTEGRTERREMRKRRKDRDVGTDEEGGGIRQINYYVLEGMYIRAQNKYRSHVKTIFVILRSVSSGSHLELNKYPFCNL